nr:WRKY transcription factor 10 [Crocus sativus]
MVAEDDKAKAGTAPTRPANISLPPRSSYESLFLGGGAGVSPGPMTLVSSFFAEDPDSEYRSFSQLLAGAMNSPAAVASPSASGGGGGGGPVRGMRPGGLVLSQQQPAGSFFMVTAGMSPGGLLDTPGIFLSNMGPFGMSHQQALAQVTAQAVQSHSHMHLQAEFPASFSEATTVSLMQPTSSSTDIAPQQQMPRLTSDANNNICDQRSQLPTLVVDKPVEDGYNWRKYGQKQVKGSEYPRSYYKCTYPNCPVKKKVERSLQGVVTEIIYKGQHSHEKPPPGKRGKEVVLPNGSNEPSRNPDFPAESISQGVHGNFGRSGEIMAAPSTSKRERESAHGTSEQLLGSSDGEEVGDAELRTDDGVDSEPDSKRRIVEARATTEIASHRTVTEPRIIVQTTSEVDLLDDGYRWRKYGQKVVKGNPHPRSYYKCTFAGCNVRKHVERASTDAKAVITTYEGKHNHNVPQARNSSHYSSTLNNSQVKSHSAIPNNQPSLRNDVQRPVAVLRLKEEHELT